MFGWAGVTSEADNVTTTRGIFTDVGLQREVGTATRGSLYCCQLENLSHH